MALRFDRPIRGSGDRHPKALGEFHELICDLVQKREVGSVDFKRELQSCEWQGVLAAVIEVIRESAN